MKQKTMGTIEVVCTFKFRLGVSLWDALKMRLMGRRPAAIILNHVLKVMESPTA